MSRLWLMLAAGATLLAASLLASRMVGDKLGI
jgi:hypothetical protein